MATNCNLLLLFIFFCFSGSSNGANNDTLNRGDVFDNTTFLVSQNGLFTLGFFRFDYPSIPSLSYLGIWYSDYPNRPVWVANRENPILDDSGALTIDETGKLKITYSGGDLVELFSAQTINISAILLNSGNFVVKDVNSNMGANLWESFDYPSDSLLPGMKLGKNLKTGKKWVLTSWLTESIPAPGAFTLEWDPNELRLVVRRRGLIYWTSGKLSGNKFEFIMEDEYQFNYRFASVANSDEEYFTYSLIDSPILAKPEFANVSQWSLYYEGSIVDGERAILGGIGCAGTNTDRGCEKWEGESCRRNGDQFQERRGEFDGGSEMESNSSISISDCRDVCWRNCSCTGFQTFSNGTGCIFWSGKFAASLNVNAVTRYVMILGPRPSDNKVWIWVLIAVVAGLLMMLMGILFYLRRRRLRLEEKFLHELMTFESPDDEALLESDGNKDHNLKIYSVASIKAATNNFSAENKLGQGGFGPVYKGKLTEGREVAVKRLSRSSGQGLVEFKNELILIAKLQHTNLVQLLGFCIQGEEKMLVYEYMPNKSLDSFIFDPSNRKLLDWKKRLNIIEGIAQGLLYLHRYSRLKIIHRDLKVSNVLLDENMNPKISDFGLARIFRNEAEANTNRVVGTYGYMSPEYAMEGTFSVKSDVFSFGVIVLEIVSGRKNNSSFIHYEHTLNLVAYAWELWKEGRALELMDPTLSESSYSKGELIKCINVGLLCVEDNPTNRPTMSGVISMLSSDATTLPSPKQPAFSLRRFFSEKNQSASFPITMSINDISISAMDAP